MLIVQTAFPLQRGCYDQRLCCQRTTGAVCTHAAPLSTTAAMRQSFAADPSRQLRSSNEKLTDLNRDANLSKTSNCYVADATTTSDPPPCQRGHPQMSWQRIQRGNQCCNQRMLRCATPRDDPGTSPTSTPPISPSCAQLVI